MSTVPQQPISVSMALIALSEAVVDVQEAQQALSEARGLRDDLIRNAVDAGVSQTRLARLTKLTREQVNRISGKPYVDESRSV